MEEAQPFYRDVLVRLADAAVPYLVGGAYALRQYVGIARDTKDLDIFLRRSDLDRARSALEAAGHRTDLTHPHFLAKTHEGDRFVDLIFGSGNGVTRVDDDWFRYAVPGELYGQRVHFCPVVEMIWSKSLIMERERYDGHDVAHLIRGAGDALDWDRLVGRFGRNWRILLAHLILFGFIYPGDQHLIPSRVMEDLLQRLANDRPDVSEAMLCRGTLLSRAQYLYDIAGSGLTDARLAPTGAMSAEEIARWTAAIDEEESHPLLPQ